MLLVLVPVPVVVKSAYQLPMLLYRFLSGKRAEKFLVTGFCAVDVVSERMVF
jgi:hypothetical protein